MAIEASDNFRLYERKKNRLIQEMSKANAHRGDNIALQKDTSNLFRHRATAGRKIDVRDFNHVLSIDAVRQVAQVEGMTTYDTLVRETLKYGLLPTVVPELKSISVGGALSGIGVESSSFRYGLVHETIEQFDVLLSDGRVLDCRRDNEQADLFYAFPNSYGTLGYALKVTVRLVPAKKYVKLNYLHFSDAGVYFSELEKICVENRREGAVAFVDGVVFDPHHLVLITGEMVDRAPYINHYQYLNIFYKAVEKKEEDYLTTADYIWRWDTDWFWCSKVFYLQNPVVRLLLGKWVLKSTVYAKLMRFAKRSRWVQWFAKRRSPTESVIQDVAIPIDRAVDYLNFFNEHIGITPIWLCPLYPDSQAPYPLFKMQSDHLYVNFGFWDMVPSQQKPGYYNRLIEHTVSALGGNKSLYSNVYYTPTEFWRIYDKAYYFRLKSKYDHLNQFRSLYDKCTEKR